MKIIDFPEQTAIFAENQPEYRPLVAHYEPNDPQGRVTCCWKLSWRERLYVLLTGKIWHCILTFNKPLQPQLLTVEKPVMQSLHEIVGTVGELCD